jgi:purine-binding chemotaxis protein CheW
MNHETQQSGVRSGKYLSFRLGKEEYGVEILRVREIIGLLDITELPRTPEHVRGVVNLRGRIIPVIDLRRLFGMAPQDYTQVTCIIFIEVAGAADGERFQIGAIVDSVSEVITIAADQIGAVPNFGCDVDTQFMLGVARVKDHVCVLLNIDTLLTTNDLSALRQAAQSASSLTSNTPAAAAA